MEKKNNLIYNIYHWYFDQVSSMLENKYYDAINNVCCYIEMTENSNDAFVSNVLNFIRKFIYNYKEKGQVCTCNKYDLQDLRDKLESFIKWAGAAKLKTFKDSLHIDSALEVKNNCNYIKSHWIKELNDLLAIDETNFVLITIKFNKTIKLYDVYFNDKLEEKYKIQFKKGYHLFINNVEHFFYEDDSDGSHYQLDAGSVYKSDVIEYIKTIELENNKELIFC